MKLRYWLSMSTLLAAAFSAQASASCEVTIEANDMMKFSTDLISVPATCEEVSITLKHTGSLPAASMGHNIVIADTANVQAIGTEGMSAGIDNSYIKPGDDRVYAFSKVIGGGDSTTLTFDTAELKSGGDYTFFCSFPGHWAIMKGKFEFQ
ncbi:azurin [Vibrio renipiscarius]|uniref:Azurin n=1 Tax=Vibrio renipiscarius TaxID=1461322 RepID=A0A0C2NNM4_9VIBR|nr:azurin [Vibrio renipiscarius]KII76594.1 electron transfer flavoprotein [Vibrio renipiscarius]KII77885.1 electron transfer flavoprotein [Vibrio renipiscarius]